MGCASCLSLLPACAMPCSSFGCTWHFPLFYAALLDAYGVSHCAIQPSCMHMVFPALPSNPPGCTACSQVFQHGKGGIFHVEGYLCSPRCPLCLPPLLQPLLPACSRPGCAISFLLCCTAQTSPLTQSCGGIYQGPAPVNPGCWNLAPL